jgi:hypothetical protein
LGYRPVIGLAEGVRRSCEGYRKRLGAGAEEKGHGGDGGSLAD